MKRTVVVGVVLIALIALTGCAPGPNTLANVAVEGGEVAGFWMGLWHGVIVIVTFVVSLFSDAVEMYEVHNNGGWYNFGFILGASIVLGGGSGGAAGRRRRRRRD